jgi:hypothetical protein
LGLTRAAVAEQMWSASLLPEEALLLLAQALAVAAEATAQSQARQPT